MHTEEFVLSLLSSMPDHKVMGKKRLQKLVFLLKAAGAECKTEFSLKNFGPFSADVEQSAAFLALTGDIIEREEPTGYAGYLTTVYELSDECKDVPPLDPTKIGCLVCLNSFSTVELEVASTIKYFLDNGFERDNAVDKTVYLKPSKATRYVVGKALKALSCLD